MDARTDQLLSLLPDGSLPPPLPSKLPSVTTCLCLCAGRDHYSPSAEPNGGSSSSIAQGGKNIYVVESSLADKSIRFGSESQRDYIYFHFFRVKLRHALLD